MYVDFNTTPAVEGYNRPTPPSFAVTRTRSHGPASESESYSTDNELEFESIPGCRRLKSLETVVALHDFAANCKDELSFSAGAAIEVLSKDAEISGGEGWWTGRIGDVVGVFPSNFVQPQPKAEKEKPQLTVPLIPFLELKLEEFIGDGGFGKVHRGTWRNNVVAIKVAKVDPDRDTQELLANVKDEARLFHMCQHENIVGFFGACLDLPLCLVLEYCAGGSLSRALAGRKISAQVLINWAVQIARGMKYLHEDLIKCILHRDLKSGNVMLKQPICDDNLDSIVLKITDFGLAKEACTTMKMSAAGTYAYMSPEVIKSSTFSRASDVWSYGVLVWELLTGEVPYRGLDTFAIAYGVALNKLSLPIPSTCPVHLVSIMEGCWKLESSERPTFGQLVETMEELNRTSAMWLSDDDSQFYTLQERWKEEIQQLFDEVKEREHELQAREEKLALVAQQQREQAEALNKRAADLEKREMNLLHRELALFLKDKQSEEPAPNVATRHGKFHKRKLFKLLRTYSTTPTGHTIGTPQNFTHQISVQRITPSSVSSSTDSPPSSPNLSHSIVRNKGSRPLNSPTVKDNAWTPNSVKSGHFRICSVAQSPRGLPTPIDEYPVSFVKNGRMSRSTPSLNKIVKLHPLPIPAITPLVGKSDIPCSPNGSIVGLPNSNDLSTPRERDRSRSKVSKAKLLDCIVANVGLMAASVAAVLQPVDRKLPTAQFHTADQPSNSSTPKHTFRRMKAPRSDIRGCDSDQSGSWPTQSVDGYENCRRSYGMPLLSPKMACSAAAVTHHHSKLPSGFSPDTHNSKSNTIGTPKKHKRSPLSLSLLTEGRFSQHPQPSEKSVTYRKQKQLSPTEERVVLHSRARSCDEWQDSPLQRDKPVYSSCAVRTSGGPKPEISAPSFSRGILNPNYVPATIPRFAPHDSVNPSAAASLHARDLPSPPPLVGHGRAVANCAYFSLDLGECNGKDGSAQMSNGTAARGNAQRPPPVNGQPQPDRPLTLDIARTLAGSGSPLSLSPYNGSGTYTSMESGISTADSSCLSKFSPLCSATPKNQV